MECTCKILAGGRRVGQLGQVKSLDIKISFGGGGGGLILVYTHTQDRLGKSPSALADARLKIVLSLSAHEEIF